jgi:hypothetical protein
VKIRQKNSETLLQFRERLRGALERVLSFKVSEVIFGGGRLTVRNKEIPLDYAAFCEVYQEAIQKATHKAAGGDGNESKVNTPPTAGTADSAPETGGRRARRPKGEVEPSKEDQAADDTGEAPEPPDSGDDDSTGESDLPLCLDAERIFKQHADNPESVALEKGCFPESIIPKDHFKFPVR